MINETLMLFAVPIDSNSRRQYPPTSPLFAIRALVTRLISI